MQGKVKITKRQIKEDKFTTFMLTARDEVTANWQFIVVGVVVVVLAVVAVMYYIDSQQVRKVEAGQLFAQTLVDYRSGDRQVAILGFTEIIDNYGSDDVAEESTYLLGKLNFIDRNYPEATRYYEMYLSKYKGNLLNRAASLAGIAAAHENQGEYTQAASKFLEAANEYPTGPLAGDYQFSAMRSFLESGDIAAARERLEFIQKEWDGTEWSVRGVRLFHEKGQTQSKL